jgi:hypothetical protein
MTHGGAHNLIVRERDQQSGLIIYLGILSRSASVEARMVISVGSIVFISGGVYANLLGFVLKEEQGWRMRWQDRCDTRIGCLGGP